MTPHRRPSIANTIALLLALAAVATAIAGCGEPTSPIVVQPGSYVLVAVNGQPLPYFGTDTVYSGALDVGRDGKFNAVTCFSADEPCYHPLIAYRNVIEHGSYYVFGDTVALRPYAGSTRILVAASGVLVQTPGPLQPDRFAGLTLRYEHQ